MKSLITAIMMTIAISATAMPYNVARNEALFLSDKMAYELELSPSQYEAVFEINLDYLLNVDDRSDVIGFWWDVRNRDLRHVLNEWQYDQYIDCEWFYHPVAWRTNGFSFTIYNRYNRGRMFMHLPTAFDTFRGGHSHRNGSFYVSFHFDRPVHHKVHERRPVIGHTDRLQSSFDRRPVVGHTDRLPSNFERRPIIGHTDRLPSSFGRFGRR